MPFMITAIAFMQINSILYVLIVEGSVALFSNRYSVHQGPRLLTRNNFNPSMDK